MTTHTPLPWKAHGCAIYQADDWHEGKNLGGAYIVGLVDNQWPTNQEIANAELIVTAVNNHQVLHDALNALLTWIETTHKAWPAQDDAWGKSTINRARQALNQTKP